MEAEGARSCGMRKVVHDVREQPTLFVGFTAYKTFAVLLFLDGFFFPGTFQVAGFELSTIVPFLFICAGVCLFFAFRFKKIKVFDKDAYLWFLVGSMVLGVFFLFMETHAGIADDAFRFATLALGMVLLAVGTMGIHIELGRIFGMLGMTPTLTFGIASALATGVLSLGIALLDPLLRWVIAFVLPAFVVLLFYCAKGKAFPDQKVLYRESTNDLLIPYRFMATSVTQGLALGIPLGFLSFSGFLSQMLDSVGYFFAASLALLAVLVLQMDFNRSIYQIGFPLAGAGLLAVGVLGPTSVMAGVLQVTGFLYLDLVLWGLGSYLIKNCRQPATWVAACPTTSLMAGRTLGAVLGAALLQLLPAGFGWNTLLCAAAFCFVMAALLLSNAANLRTGWGFVRPGGPDDGANAHRACQIVAEDFSLTQREFEVLRRIVEGESRADVAEALFIAPNTVKTHLHSIYAKLDVHNVRDLRAYVDNRRRSFSPSSENEEILENDA